MQTADIINMVIIYVLILTVFGFCICAYDKRAAIKKRWRVSEKALFVIALLGGSLGIFIAMFAVRHKTRRWYFMTFMPMIIIAQTVLFICLFGK